MGKAAKDPGASSGERRSKAKPAAPKLAAPVAVQADPELMVGNQAMLRALRDGGLLGRPDDAQERQARQVAEAEAAGRLEPTAGAGADRLPSASPVARRLPLHPLGGGRPLDADLRDHFEGSLGTDLGDVRLHTGPEAHRAARAVGARAYTAGPDVVFGAGEWQPESAGGRALLAHELTHVRQQAEEGSALVQREPLGSDTQEETMTLVEGAPDLVITHRNGWVFYSFGGIPWIILQWEPEPGFPEPKVAFSYSSDGILQFAVLARAPVKMIVNQELERAFFNHTTGRGHVRLQIDGPVSLEINNSDGTLRETFGDQDIFHTHRGIGEEGVYLPPSKEFLPDLLEELRRQEEGLPTDIPEGEDPELAEGTEKPKKWEPKVWTFGDRAGLDAFAAGHPKTRWAGIVTAEGKYVAWALTEEALRRVAEVVRGQRASHEPLRYYPGGQVTGVYIDGKELTSFDELANLYFRSPTEAAIGADGESRECEVFHMGRGSYGRIPYSHAEALDRWSELDKLTSDKIMDLKSGPKWEFHSLIVENLAGLQTLDWDYFKARDQFYARADDFNSDALVYRKDRPGRGGQTPLNYYITSARGSAGRDLRRYLLIESSREQGDPRFRSTLEARRHLAAAVSDEIVGDVEARGQRIALAAIDQGKSHLDKVASNLESARELAANYHLLPRAQQDEVAEFLAVPEDERLRFRVVLAEPDAGMKVAFGLDQAGLNLEMIQGYARENAKKLDGLRQQIKDWDIVAARVEGGFGDQIRDQVYREVGFRQLKGSDYPHNNLSGGLSPFPEALSGDAADYTSIAEQMYINRRAHQKNAERLMVVMAVSAAVLGTVALVLVANAAGAAVAGMFFASGSAAFIATEVVVGGLVLTALEVGVDQVMTGGQMLEADEDMGSGAKLALHAGKNVATFGIFRLLNVAFAAVSKGGVTLAVGGKAAFEASKGAQAAANAFRITGIGLTFFGISLEQYKKAHGHYPEGEELAIVAYESALTLAMLEAGGVLLRPLMSQMAVWQRGKRLGGMAPKVDKLTADIQFLQADLAGLAARPQSMAVSRPRILERQTELLERQKSILTEMRKSFRTRADAKHLERLAAKEMAQIDAALARLRQANFLQGAEVRAAGEQPGQFFYKPGTEAEVKAFYGAKNVSGPDAQGRLVVRHAHRTMVFHPSGTALPTTAPAATGPQGAPRPIIGSEVRARQVAVLAQAKANGLTGPEITSIRRLQPHNTKDAGKLANTEKLVTEAEIFVAESVAGAQSPPPSGPALAVRRGLVLKEAGQQAVDHPKIKALDGMRPGAMTNEQSLRQASAAISAAEVALANRLERLGTRDFRRQQLAERQQALIDRADFLSLNPASIQAIRGLKPKGAKSAKQLRDIDTAITQAETQGGAALDTVSKAALTRVRNRITAAGMARLRSGQLAEMTDRQVGDALQASRGMQGLGELELRGVLFAAKGSRISKAQKPVDLRILNQRSRSADERNFILGTYARLREARIPGTHDVLTAMTASRTSWRGGVWMLEFARAGVRLENMRAFEVREADAAIGVERFYDIVMTNGKRLELKDWRNWFPKSVRKQVRKDFILSTQRLKDPTGLDRTSWIFRKPAPRNAAEIRSLMEATLESTMTEFKVPEHLKPTFRQHLANHRDLVIISEVNRNSQSIWPAPEVAPPTPVPREPDAERPIPAIPQGSDGTTPQERAPGDGP